MQAIIDRLTREPVILINIVKAILTLLVVFGIALSPDQQNSIVELIVALTAIFGVGAAVERQVVTPLTHPRVPENTVVHVYGDDGKTVAEKEV